MYFTTTILLVLVSYAAQHSFGGDRDELWPWPRIVNGQDAQDNAYPFQVALLDNGTIFCGGVILTSNFVVTAEHCIYQLIRDVFPTIIEIRHVQRKLSTLSVRAGSPSHSEGGQVVGVSDWLPDVKPYRDIALMRLASPLILNGANVAAIPLATSPPPQDALVTIVGWGQNSKMGPVADHLQASQFNVVAETQCMRTGNIICLHGNDLSTVCNGDSGGAVIYEGTLVGVVTYADVYCEPNEPVACSSIPANIDWLKENVDL